MNKSGPAHVSITIVMTRPLTGTRNQSRRSRRGTVVVVVVVNLIVIKVVLLDHRHKHDRGLC